MSPLGHRWRGACLHRGGADPYADAADGLPVGYPRAMTLRGTHDVDERDERVVALVTALVVGAVIGLAAGILAVGLHVLLLAFVLPAAVFAALLARRWPLPFFALGQSFVFALLAMGWGDRY